jgi:uncharacterized protein YggE
MNARIVLRCGVLAALAAAGPASAAAQDRPEAPEIRASATASRQIPPDLATLTVRFSAPGATPLEAGQRLAGRTDSLRQALAAIGIPRDSVVNGSRWYWWPGRIQPVVSQRCEPWPDRRGCTPVADTTFVAHETLTARIRRLERVGAAIDTVLAHGISNIEGLNFVATDLRDAYREALREATEKTRRDAEVIAEAGGVRLGRLLSLGTSSDRAPSAYDYVSVRGLSAGVEGSPSGVPGTVIMAPSVMVSVTVYGRWEVEQPRR